MAKRRRVIRPAADPLRASHQLLDEVQAKLGVGIIVTDVDPGPPCTVVALLTFGAQREQVTITAENEPRALADLARAAAEWRQSNAISITTNWWGGA
jgi:hypothetical protein